MSFTSLSHLPGRLSRLAVTAVSIGLSASSPAFAAERFSPPSPAPDPLQEVQSSWRRIGPEGGRICRLATVAAAPARLYAVAGSRTLYRSDDAGQTFAELGVVPGLAECAIAVGADSPDLLYAVGRLPDAPPEVLSQLLVSDDGGQSWSRRSDLPWEAGTYSTTLHSLATAGGEVLLIKGRNVLLRSVDQGRTFVPASGLAGNLPLVAVELDPFRAATVYLVRGSGGVLVSRDAGGRFTPSNQGFARPLGEVVALSAAPERRGRLYALVQEASPRLYVSSDGGARWTAAGGGPIAATRGASLLAVGPDTVYVTALREGRRLWRSTDGGSSLVALRAMPPDITLARLPAVAGSAIAVFGGQGLFRSDDAGRSWRPNVRGIRAGHVAGLAVEPSDPRSLVGIFEPQGLLRSTDGGVTWTSLAANLARDLGVGEDPFPPVASVPGRPRRLLLATNRRTPAGQLPHAGLASSIDRGNRWQQALELGCQRVGTLAVDPTNYLHVIVGTQAASAHCPTAACFVYASDDGGGSWSCLDDHFPDGVIGAGLRFASNGDLWASTHESLLRSHDGGLTWEKRGTARVTVSGIDATDPERLYATLVDDGGSFRISLYRSDDAGLSWGEIGDGALVSNGPNLVAADPQVPGRIAVSTPGGIFLSVDAGGSLAPLPDLVAAGGGWVGQLEIAGDTLLVGTSSGLFAHALATPAP